MTVRLSDQVTYAYCGGCGNPLIAARQAEFSPEDLLGRTRRHIWHSWCAVTATWTARQGQQDRRN